MAVNQVPDQNSEYMKKEFGTVVLITDSKSDYLLKKAARLNLKNRKQIIDSWTI